MFFLPSLPIDFNRVSSILRVLNILLLNDLAFPASYKKPVLSSIIVSLEPPMLLAIIGFSIDCASTATLPKASGSVEAEITIVISASTEPEAFGRVAVEAQSMEKPIIASNIGGSNETIIDERTGFLYEAGNAKSLSNKILRTLNMDETLLKSIGNEGRKNIVQKFNVEKMCFSTYSEYKRLIN